MIYKRENSKRKREKEKEGKRVREMKRSRDIMEKRSEISSAIEELSMMLIVKPSSGLGVNNHHHHEDSATAHIPNKPFLSLCYLVLQVLDKIGPTMAVLRQDVHQNIKRLEVMQESNPSLNSNLVEILKSEASNGNVRKRSSCSKAFVWLTRSLDFATALLQALTKDPKKSMEQVVEESYAATLAEWHGWISSAAFKVALKLVPDSKTFMDLLREKDESCETLKEKMQIMVSLFVPLLEDIHCILRVYNLDRIKST